MTREEFLKRHLLNICTEYENGAAPFIRPALNELRKIMRQERLCYFRYVTDDCPKGPNGLMCAPYKIFRLATKREIAAYLKRHPEAR